MQHRARTVTVRWRGKPPLRRAARFTPLRGFLSTHRVAAGVIGHRYIVQPLESGVDPQPP